MKVFEFVSRKIFTPKAEAVEASFVSSNSASSFSHDKQELYYDNYAYGENTNKIFESNVNATKNHCHETESEPKKEN